MGCDIHAYIEKKNEKTEKWEKVTLYRVDKNTCEIEPADFYTNRNYRLFSILAGVRGELDPLVEPRGLPNDLSWKMRDEEDSWDGGYHTPTWYDLSELMLFKKIHKDDSDYESFCYFVDCVIHYLEMDWNFIWDIPKPGYYRVIIWFDS